MSRFNASRSADGMVAWLDDFIARAESKALEIGPEHGSCGQMPLTVPRKPVAPPNPSTLPTSGAKTLPREPNTLRTAVRRFGINTKTKLSNPAIKGQPEDQLRAPLERLLSDLAELRVPGASVTAVGETSQKDIKTRPDYAVTVSNVLVGFVEVKAPGKGADPRKFTDKHDKQQWLRLQALPNLVYTDGNQFSLWHNGEPIGSVVHLIGDVETSGADLDAPDSLLTLIDLFLQWEPVAPRDVKQLADTSARLCRLLREEVAEQLALKNPALTALAKDWRRVLFPDATDATFADGYAQAVTFGMLMARARNISLAQGLTNAAQKLGHTLIGAALRVLTFSAETASLTSIGTLVRVLGAVDWGLIGKGDKTDLDAWLYFYEDFLATYDNALRKQTGVYYTPAPVVSEMVRLVDEVLRTRFDQVSGLASDAVMLADPAVGTGTFLLGVLRRIATTVEADRGAGAVAGAIDAAIKRLIAFEIQLGPFAVAQLRILAELKELIGAAPATTPRMFVTDTLANPYVEQEWLPYLYEEIAESRRQANEIKKHERIMVVLGNPPYKEKAMGRGGWIEEGDDSTEPPLNAWLPPKEWGVGAHAKHLRNLYVYFWRWATWKVFDQNPDAKNGIVCFISTAGFLNGPGFQKMRDYLRRTTDEIWVIDCSPEGNRPDVPTRIFEEVSKEVCIVLASRSPSTDESVPARVRFRSLVKGTRSAKFESLRAITLDDPTGWADCSTAWRSAFLPAATGAWAQYVPIDECFAYSGSGVQPKRTWIYAPDAESLIGRWDALTGAPREKKEELFHPTLRNGKPADRHIRSVVAEGLPRLPHRATPIIDESGPCASPVRYAFQSFNRQWIIPDTRVITQPNRDLWETLSERQVYLTAVTQTSPTGGPAVTFTALVPDLDHYNGRGGRVFPLWLDSAATTPNVRPGLLTALNSKLGRPLSANDVFAYIAGVLAHPAYTSRFQNDLAQPGLRVPITSDASMFFEAVELGRMILWLHTFGERFTDPKAGRQARPPRLSSLDAPKIPKGGAIGMSTEAMPDKLWYAASERRLHVGDGYVDGVPQEVWDYEVSGKQVLRTWFSYRKVNRERPIIGDRRPPSALGSIQPDHWLDEYTTELLNVLHVLGRLVELEPAQATLLDRICSAPTLTLEELRLAGAFEIDAYPRKPTAIRRTGGDDAQKSLFDTMMDRIEGDED
jgi:hypothetical protein